MFLCLRGSWYCLVGEVLITSCHRSTGWQNMLIYVITPCLVLLFVLNIVGVAVAYNRGTGVAH